MKKKLLAILCMAAVLISGCSAQNKTDTAETSGTAITEETASEVEIEHLSAVQTSANADIVLGESITSSADGVVIDGSTVTITKKGTYTVQGTLADGQIIVDCESGNVELVLGGVDITNKSGSAIYAKDGDLTLTLDNGSVNIVTDGSEYNVDSDENSPNASIFTQDDLTIAGNGTLQVYGNYNNGINCKDNFSMESGEVHVKSVDDGIIGKESVTVLDGALTISAEGDGIKSTYSEDVALGYVKIENGTFNITCGGDAITAQTDLTISNGTFNLITGGGSENGATHTESFGFWSNDTDNSSDSVSAKALKAGSSITAANGTFVIDSADDAFHSNGTGIVSGGTWNITSGDDGFHADTQLEIADGEILVSKSYEGIESAIVLVSGGNISVTASDDGVNVAGGNDSSAMGRPGENSFNADNGQYLKITGGTLYVNAEGDGLDSNGSATIEGGTVYVDGPTNSGNGALDYNSSFTVTGGTLIACGSTGMMQVPTSDSTINSISVTQNFSAGSKVTIKNSSGDEVISYTLNKTAGNVTFTSALFIAGETYTATVDVDDIGEVVVESGVNYVGDAVNTMGGFGGGFGGGKQNFDGQKPDGDFSGEFNGEKPDFSGEMPDFDGEMPEGGFGGRGNRQQNTEENAVTTAEGEQA